MPLDQSRAARRSLSMAMVESFVDAVCWWIDRRGAGIMRGGRRVWTGRTGRTDWIWKVPLSGAGETHVSRERLLPASLDYSEDA
jgi:hypothetical protein